MIYKEKEIISARVSNVYGNAKAIVTIISDDGVYESALNLNTMLRERHLTATIAGVVALIKLHKTEWNFLLKENNLELVNHSYNHIRMDEENIISYDVNALEHEILDSNKWFSEFTNSNQIVFVCPENQMCKAGYRILGDNGFYAVRRGKRGYNNLSPNEGVNQGDWFNLMVQGICDNGVDLETRNCWIDTVIKDNKWLIEMWHNVMPSPDNGYQTILFKDAIDHLDYISSKVFSNEIWCATFSQAVKYIREKQNSVVNAYIENNRLHVSVLLNNLSYELFNQPLTVLIDLNGISSVITDKNSNKYSVDVIPGQEVIIELS